MNQSSPGNNESGEYYSEFSSTGSFAKNGIIQDLGQNIVRYNIWIKILAITTIIQGIILVCTIIGILVAWLPIWTGIVLWKMSNNFKNAVNTGETVEFETALSRMRLFFKLSGITILLTIMFYIFIAIFGVSVLSGLVFLNFFSG